MNPTSESDSTVSIPPALMSVPDRAIASSDCKLETQVTECEGWPAVSSNATNRNVLRLRGHETRAIERQSNAPRQPILAITQKTTRASTRFLPVSRFGSIWREVRRNIKMSTQAPASTAPQQPLAEPTTIIPEWDSNAVQTHKAEVTTSHSGNRPAAKAILQEKFDAILPKSRSYLVLKRRTLLIVLACTLLALLALIIGLAVGLIRHSKG